jgi:endonuclease/exonuclease/phosphatase family metal-dependent hydrolase
MKTVLHFLTATLLCISCNSNTHIDLNVMSFNIRLNTASDSLNSWQYRKDVAARVVSENDIDIAGAQEVTYGQLKDLLERLPEYRHIGAGRADGKNGGEFSAIFYKKDRFEVVNSGTFWLSETPDSIGKKGWDAACERVATWAVLEETASARRFFVLNTHLDHIGTTARRESARLIADTVAKHCDLPVIVTGDFNCEPDSEPIKTVLDEAAPVRLFHARDFAEIKHDATGTFHNFGRIPENKRSFIDYIFISRQIKALEYSVLPDKIDSVFVSDHAPVAARLELR